MSEDTDHKATNVSPRSYQGALVDGKPSVLMYDSEKDETSIVDVDHPFYAQAMAAFSILEMSFAPALQEKPKKTILHVERPKLIRGLHS